MKIKTYPLSKQWVNLSRVCIILFIILFGSLNLNAQNQKITLPPGQKTLMSAFEEIEKQTKMTIAYNESVINVKQMIRADVSGKSLSETMTILLKDTNTTYKIQGDRIIIVAAQPQAPKKKYTGTILDNKEEPIIGASVALKGNRAIGTITDENGNFSLEAPVGSTIIISYLGFNSQELKLGDKTVLDITLLEDTKLLDEIVVVGYGTQKKINLTGSVASVNGKSLESRPISNTSVGLQGHLPGVTITNANSRPGDSNTTIRIRGEGTIGDSNPLILIDGIEGNMNTLNPDDIESVSVLKDAGSSAIYGSRAANGVILITTKKAKKEESTIINYNGNFAWQMPVKKPEMLGAEDYLILLKEATQNVNKSSGYTMDDLEKIRNGSDPNNLANTNWIDEVYRSSAPQQTHNLSISGGSKTMGYYASYGHLSSDGLVANNAYRGTRNNARLKLNTEMLDRLSLEANFGYTDVDNWTPMSSDGATSGVFYQALRSSPLVPVRFTDGKWGYGGSSANPVALLHDGGFINFKSNETVLNSTATLKLIEGLTAQATYGIRKKDVLRKNQTNIVEHFYPDTNTSLAYSSNTSTIRQRDVSELYQSINAQIDYDKTINKHQFHVLVGYGQEWMHYEQMEASRENLVSDNLHVIDAGTEKQLNTGYAYHWALRSGFGRATYNYDNRYLLEVNMRYDLSSRFHNKYRGSFFPSGSAAWRISEEEFMNSTRSFLNNLKLRVSYGTLGNQYVGSSYYPYLSLIESGTGMPIGGDVNTTMEQVIASNNRLSWESIHMFNIGFDLSVLNNRLSLTADYFIKNTKDILLQVELPGVLGVSTPYQNAGKVRNQGWELNLSWNDKIGKDFSYGVNANISDVKNKVTSLGDVADNFGGNQVIVNGYAINSFWGYKADGLATFDDFDYNPSTDKYNAKIPIIEAYRTKYSPGDIKLVDLDGDGKITPEKDRTYLGSPIPRYTYSFGGEASWKNFDFSFFFQGVRKCDGLVNGLGRHAFTELANHPQKEHMKDRWTFENPNPNAKYPRLTYDETYNQSNFSSYWLEDASYLRLKNIQLGYVLPKNLLSKLRVDRCRIYFSGENLLTFTDFFGAYDPETPVSGGGYYPVAKTVSFGISLTLK